MIAIQPLIRANLNTTQPRRPAADPTRRKNVILQNEPNFAASAHTSYPANKGRTPHANMLKRTRHPAENNHLAKKRTQPTQALKHQSARPCYTNTHVSELHAPSSPPRPASSCAVRRVLTELRFPGQNERTPAAALAGVFIAPVNPEQSCAAGTSNLKRKEDNQ